MNPRDHIIETLAELYDEEDLEMPEFADDTVLLDTELDSLSYAVLVTRLDETLGYDPFSLMDEPVYPETFGEFVTIYQRYAPGGSPT